VLKKPYLSRVRDNRVCGTSRLIFTISHQAPRNVGEFPTAFSTALWKDRQDLKCYFKLFIINTLRGLLI